MMAVAAFAGALGVSVLALGDAAASLPKIIAALRPLTDRGV